jgi:hypothetical protein
MSKPANTGDVPKEVRDAMDRAMKEARERIESIDLPAHWQESIDYLDENFAFFLTHVLNMGKPEWEYGIKTAAVALPMTGADTADFRYVFNPVFASLLEPEEFAFIEAHETMHVLLNHLRLLEKGKKVGKFKDPQKFNVAADCVINDYLTSMGLDAGRFRELGCFGPDIVKYDCANATVSEVYLDIPDNMGEGGDEEGGGGACSGGGSNVGGGLGEYMDGTSKSDAMGSHDWMHDPEDAKAQGQAADDIGKNTPGVPQDIDDKKQDDDHKGTPGAGPGSEAGAMRNFVEQKGVSMKWAELLREVDPEFFKSGGPRKRPSFHTPRRKMMGVYEKFPNMGTLPVMADPPDPKGETPSIVMFMDGSGSCSDWIQNFATLAKSVPPAKLHLRAWSFSTYTVPFDVTEDNPRLASGGTMFSPIEETIQKEVVPELGHYPKAVVIMTDLEGGFSGPKPKKEDQDKWLWLATHGGRYDYRGNDKFGKVISIEEFCEGMPDIKAPTNSWR